MNKGFRINVAHTINHYEYEFSENAKYFASTRTMLVDEEMFHLTHREHLFIVHLVQSKALITYAEINKLIGVSTQNANRLFIKNLRKKIPKNMIKNVSGIGYKLIL